MASPADFESIKSQQGRCQRFYTVWAGGSLPLSDKSSPEDIHRLFGVSKGTFKKAIGGLYKKGLILIHPERIELPR